MKEKFVNMLIAELESLKTKGVQGVRDFELIQSDMESKFSRNIEFLRNDQFELMFNKKSHETELKTTFSGQLINNDFMSQLRMLEESKATIHTMISTILALVEVEAAK